MHAEQTKEPTLDQIRAISARQEVCREEERRGLARRMHNELSQKTTVLGLELSLLGMDAGTIASAKVLKEKIAELSTLAGELSQSIRDITNQIHPIVIDEFGLVGALQWYANSLEKEMRCTVIAPATEIALSPSATHGLFTLTQALVGHVFRPAKVSLLEIRLEKRANQVHLRLSGEHKTKWKLPSTDEAQLDWLAIQEQALQIEGKIKLTAIPGVGTSVVCSLPFQPVAGTPASP